jgi:hypothetical protein
MRCSTLVNADRDRIVGLGRAAGSALNVHQALQRRPIAEKKGRRNPPLFSCRDTVTAP